MSTEIPDKISKYDIKDVIGIGSIGRVYLGYDPFVDRFVAIKSARNDIHSNKADYQKQLRHFFKEARTAGKLDHANIVSIYDAGIEYDTRYIIMEYVDGDTLKYFCKPKNLLPIERVVDIAFKCCKVLNYSMQKGVIHRDIKPTNIMLSKRNETKVMDFSIALNSDDSTEISEVGLMGTPAYMSPEQVSGKELTHLTDIFSLGSVLYELLTGKPPFKGETLHSVIFQIMNEQPEPIHRIRSDVPVVLEQIILRSMQKRPEDRFQSGQAFYTALSKAFTKMRSNEIEISQREKIKSIKKLTFFRDFSDNEVHEVLKASHWLTYKPNEVVMSEGDIEQAFYIIIEGSTVVKKNDQIINSIEAGGCIGEMGYLTKEKRTASIFAHNHVAALKVNASSIESASLSCQLHFHKVFLATLITRLSQSSRAISKMFSAENE